MKKILYIFLAIFGFLAFGTSASAGASLSTSASSVTSGSSFSVSVNLSGVAAWEVHVSATGPVSGCSINAADSTEDASNGSKSYSATCKTVGTGNVTVSLSGNATTASGSRSNLSGSKTVAVVNKTSSSSSSSSAKSYSTNNKSSNSNSSNNSNNSSTSNTNDSKSSDNTLKSLSVEGQNIDFNKDKTDYTLTLSNEIKQIKINAETNDSKASVEGTGDKNLSEGENSFDIVVTAENGDKKTYNLKVTVDEKPIVVKIGNKEYTVVKNKDELPLLALEHEDITLQIEEQDVPAYRIDKLNYVLVGLKDSKGKIRLYKFDSYKDPTKPFKYTLFREFSSKNLSVSYLDFPKKLIPKGYKKYKETINGEKVYVYKLSKNSKYSLFYGINLETGKKHIYRYDSNEGTIQIYDDSESKAFSKTIEEYEIYILGLIFVSALLLLIIVILGISKRKKIRKILNHYARKEKDNMHNLNNENKLS